MDSRLFDAVENNDISLVRNLLNSGVNINQRDRNRETAIFIAIANGNLPMVNILINNGADINIINHNNDTPLIGAIQMNRIDIVKCLLQTGAEINGSYNGRDRPLTEAVYNGFPEITQFLLDHGATPFYTDNDGDTLINVVCLTPIIWEDSNYQQTLLILLNYRDAKGNKLDVDIFNEDGDTPLAIVAHYKNLNLASILLDYKENEHRKSSMFIFPRRDNGADPSLINWDEISIEPEIREFIENYSVQNVKEPEFN
jgi:ankyrin repeat protein